MDTLTKSFIDYLYKGWDQNKNPQAGFRFTFKGIECEIWLNTHPKYHIMYIFNGDGGTQRFRQIFLGNQTITTLGLILLAMLFVVDSSN